MYFKLAMCTSIKNFRNCLSNLQFCANFFVEYEQSGGLRSGQR